MKKLNKTVHFLTAVSIASASALLPVVSASAVTSSTIISQEQANGIVVSENDEVINLFKDNQGMKVLETIPSNSEITILEKGGLYTFVSYQDIDRNQEIKGYILDKFISNPTTNIHNDTSETNINNSDEINKTQSLDDAKAEDQPVENSDSTSINKEREATVVEDDPKMNDSVESNTNIDNDDSMKIEGNIEEKEKDESSKSTETIPTEDNINSNEIKPKVQTRAVQTFATQAAPAQEKLQGIALKSTTNVFSNPSDDALSIKSYSEGTLLKFKTYSDDWYEANVYINGKATTGYIHKSDVEIPVANQEKLQGIALDSTTKVYSKASTSASSLRTYTQGTILKFKTYTNDWYKANVYINGKATTGYIHKSDVEIPVASQEKLQGIALDSTTKVYAKASTSASSLRTYTQGAILKFKTFTEDWYEANVYINGKATTGYIHKSDVEIPVASQEKLQGITLDSTTKVYAKASTSASSLRTYTQGTILKFKTYTRDWYEANVYINGKATTGYIYKKDLELLYSSQQKLQGIALKTPTKIYARASTNSKVIKDYSAKAVLKYKSFSKNWYEANVYINGKAITGYINVNDVAAQSYYNLSLKEAVAMQTKANPQTDAYGFWGDATASQLEYYMNPLNFSPTSDSYYQFLVLSSYSGTEAEELNNTVLKNKGVLSGMGAAFIYAAEKYGINEIYLISHALLETGNGTSSLATGIEVNGTTVHNVYGIGAYDYDPDGGGSQYAFNSGWTSVEKAIIGGAQFVSTNYILAGQNTLYKMRWNPEAMENYGYVNHQYATDVGWAVKQTSSIASIYNLLTTHKLEYNVPTYLEKD